MERTEAPELPQKLTLENRSRLTVSGVQDVERFDESAVVLHTCRGVLAVRGRELRLRPGFRQATVQGLTALCNDCLGEIPVKQGETPQIYRPREGQLIHRYEPEWRENRDLANGIS